MSRYHRGHVTASNERFFWAKSEEKWEPQLPSAHHPSPFTQLYRSSAKVVGKACGDEQENRLTKFPKL